MAVHPLSAFTSTNVVMTFHTVPSAEWFRGALETISRLYRFVSLEDVEAYFYGGRKFNGCCHVCFDDGERNFLECAAPVLRSMGVPATLFVSPGVLAGGGNYWFQEVRALRRQLDDATIKRDMAALLGIPFDQIEPYGVNALLKSLRLAEIWQVIEGIQARHGLAGAEPCNMTPDEVVEASRDGLIAIGAHSVSHPILHNEADADAEREICESIRMLSGLLGRPVTAFAYPNGARGLDFGPREERILQTSGARLAFTTATGYFSSQTDPLAIPRAALEPGDGGIRTWSKLLLVPAWDKLRRSEEARQRADLHERCILAAERSREGQGRR